MKSDVPFSVEIIDDYLGGQCIAKILESAKAQQDLFFYNDENAKKATTKPGGVSGAVLAALHAMAADGGARGLGEPDLTFYGAGMSVMLPGDYLNPHVDHALHPVTHKARLWNFILYLTDCEGGRLRLIGDDTELKIKPKKDRAAIFQSCGDAWHAVEKVTGGERIALSVYFYGEAMESPEKAYGVSRTNTKAVFK